MKIFLKTTIFTVLFVYLFLSFMFALKGYPGFVQDSVCFLPTAYFINHFHQLINPLYDAGIDPITHRFLFYPPLFPYTVAFITNLLPDFVNNIQVALTIIDSISIAVLLYTVYVYYKRTKIGLNVFFYVFLIAWLLSLFSFYGITDGRPEILSRFFIACFLLNNVRQDKRFYNFTDGLIIGLNLITSPISTIYLMVIKLGLFFYNNNFKLKPVIQTITGFAIVITCFTFLYPYHISELIAGLQKHSKNVIVNRAESDAFGNFIRYYIANPYIPLFILNFLVPLCYVYYILIKKNKTICILLFALLTCIVSYFSFRNMGLVYNMLVLSPFSFFLLFVIFTKILNKRSLPLFLKNSTVMIILLLFLNSAGITRKILLFYSTENDKVSYQDFRKDFIKVCNASNATNKNKKIVLTFSLWPYCLDKYKNITVWTTMITPDTSVQYIMVQQLYSGFSEPQPKPGFKVIKNSFITKHPKFGKLPLGNTYPGFQTAVYKRN